MILWFLLFTANLSLIGWGIRRRGLQSAEGLGFAFLALLVGSDGFALLWNYLVVSGAADYASQRMLEELFPSFVHLVGILVILAGLHIVDPQREPIRRALTPSDRRAVISAGVILAGLGFAMKLVAMYLWGITSLSSYLDNLFAYDISVREFGFLDQGVNIAVFGLILVAMANESRRTFQAIVLSFGFVIVTLFSTSKSGFFSLIVPFVVIGGILSPKSVKAWSRWPVLILAGAIFIVGLGLKTQIKYGSVGEMRASLPVIVETAQVTVERRFSSEGLYEGYSNLVNRIHEEPALRLHGAVLVSIFSGVIPRFIWMRMFGVDKPDHPFHARGDLVNRFYTVDQYGNDAPTLVGFAFADYGAWSLVLYLLIAGMVLGLIRRFAAGTGRSIFVLIAYMYFAANMGPAIPESGFLSLLYFLILAVSIAGLVWVIDSFRPVHLLPRSPKRLIYS